MLTETGTVVAVEDDGLWVETLKQSACMQCSAKTGCGQKLLATSAASHMAHIKAYFAEGELSHELWCQGDMAVIALEERALVKATAIAYMLPLLTMVVAVLLVGQITSGDVWVAIAALAGLLLGGFVVRSHAASAKSKSCYHARVLKRA